MILLQVWPDVPHELKDTIDHNGNGGIRYVGTSKIMIRYCEKKDNARWNTCYQHIYAYQVAERGAQVKVPISTGRLQRR